MIVLPLANLIPVLINRCSCKASSSEMGSDGKLADFSVKLYSKEISSLIGSSGRLE